MPVGTVQNIFGGITKAPRYDTLRALERVFEEVTIVEEVNANTTSMLIKIETPVIYHN